MYVQLLIISISIKQVSINKLTSNYSSIRTRIKSKTPHVHDSSLLSKANTPVNQPANVSNLKPKFDTLNVKPVLHK